MGLHYSLEVYLSRLDSWYLPVYIGWGIAMVCFYIYYWKGIRYGQKHKCSGMPWQTNMWNFANDFVYVAGFSRWFGELSPTHHWFSEFLWFGLVAWFAMEFIVHYQAIKYDLMTEMFPHAKSRKNALFMYAGIQICFIAGYWFLWSVMEDGLCHIMFLTTFTGCVIFNFQMSAKRNSKRGMAPIVPWVLIVAQIAGYFIIMPSFDPVMSNFYVYFMGVAATGLAIAYLVVYKRLPEYSAGEN
ncbi:MAG: hypothetical protein Q4C25_01500 [Bacillota bacterium]|nr:hypothetical protein [Bacillota bacterium]